MYFLDTNIFIRHLTRDVPEKAAACEALFQSIEAGDLQAWTSDLVVAELVFVLGAKEGNGYGLRRQAIAQGLLPLLALPGLLLPSKRFYPRIFELYIQHRIDFVDAFNAALIEASGVPDLYSYDRDYDRIKSLRRLEPTRQR
jgi:uncharacterized protein